MTYHLLFPTLALLMVVSAMTIWTQTRSVVQPAYASAQGQTSRSALPGRGFITAFGNGQALRNLLYTQ